MIKRVKQNKTKPSPIVEHWKKTQRTVKQIHGEPDLKTRIVSAPSMTEKDFRPTN